MLRFEVVHLALMLKLTTKFEFKFEIQQNRKQRNHEKEKGNTRMGRISVSGPLSPATVQPSQLIESPTGGPTPPASRTPRPTA
jgi:hypothetical protein